LTRGTPGRGLWLGCLTVVLTSLAIGVLLSWLQDVNTTNALAACSGVPSTDSHLPNTDVLMVFRVPIYAMCFGWGAVLGVLLTRRKPPRTRAAAGAVSALLLCAVAYCADLALIVRPC
jgi:hypothetical protein